jgi:hypothetical protein
MIAISLGLLVTSSRRIPGYLILAVSVTYKLVPAFLIPLWAVGGLRPSRRESRSDAGPGLGIGVRATMNAAVLLGLSAACFLPADISGGEKSLTFLDYHRHRGIEIESIYATACLEACLLGASLEISNSYGSANVITAWTPLLVNLATIAMIDRHTNHCATVFPCKARFPSAPGNTDIPG